MGSQERAGSPFLQLCPDPLNSGVLNVELLNLDGKKYCISFTNLYLKFSIFFNYDSGHKPVILAITMALSPIKITYIFVSYYSIADMLKYNLCSSQLQNYVKYQPTARSYLKH